MKKIIILFIGIVVCTTANAAKKKSYKVTESQAGSVHATVGFIVDGDTFAARVKLEDGIQISVRVRIINIDAPEMSGQCAAEIKMAHAARDRLGQLIPVGSTVELSEIKDDKYLGRIDARVKTVAGLDVGNKMVAENHARKYGGKKRQPWCDGATTTGTDSIPTQKTITMDDLGFVGKVFE